MGKFTIVEKIDVPMVYGFTGIRAILTSEKTGHILITSDFGGMDTLEGGSVRFKHGLVIKLKKSDTLDSLNNDRWNDYTTLLDAIQHGLDISRPVLNHDGFIVEKIANSAGLIG